MAAGGESRKSSQICLGVCVYMWSFVDLYNRLRWVQWIFNALTAIICNFLQGSLSFYIHCMPYFMTTTKTATKFRFLMHIVRACGVECILQRWKERKWTKNEERWITEFCQAYVEVHLLLFMYFIYSLSCFLYTFYMVLSNLAWRMGINCVLNYENTKFSMMLFSIKRHAIWLGKQ